MNLSTAKWAQWDKTQCRELLGLFICVCIALCTIVAHNIAQNRPDNFPSYPPDNQQCSDDVCLREGGGREHPTWHMTVISQTSLTELHELPLTTRLCVTKRQKRQIMDMQKISNHNKGTLGTSQEKKQKFTQKKLKPNCSNVRTQPCTTAAHTRLRSLVFIFLCVNFCIFSWLGPSLPALWLGIFRQTSVHSCGTRSS